MGLLRALASLLAALVLVALHAGCQRWRWAREVCASGRARHISRAPAHIAVVFDLGTDAPRLHEALADASFLIRQCAAGGASELSIYDRHGQLAAAIPSALRGQADASYGVSLARAGRVDIVGEKPALRVNLLSSADDKAAIGAAAAHGHDAGAVTDALRARGPVQSDPDVVVVKSARQTLCGFPCWSIRTSTIWYVPADQLCARVGRAHVCKRV